VKNYFFDDNRKIFLQLGENKFFSAVQKIYFVCENVF